MSNVKKPTKVQWNSIKAVGMPPEELRYQDVEHNIERQFLVKGEYSIQVAYMFRDGSGFDMPEDSLDTPEAWAVIEGF